MPENGFWWSFGHFCWRCFHGLEWMYDHLTPNKVLITVGFIAAGIWIKMQNDYTKKAEREGTYK